MSIHYIQFYDIIRKFPYIFVSLSNRIVSRDSKASSN